MLAGAVIISISALAMSAPHPQAVMPNMFKALDVNSMVKSFDPKVTKFSIRKLMLVFSDTILTRRWELDLQAYVMISPNMLQFVVVHEQRGDMPEGMHDALVKSLISDLHSVDVPVVYAQRRDLPIQQWFQRHKSYNYLID